MIELLISQIKEKMNKSVDVTATDLASIRSGRATPALVENIVISAYEGTQRLKIMEMATISTADAKTILISPYDPTQINSIAKGISEANSGLNPAVESDLIRIGIPPLSEERRREYLKLAKVKIEAGKVMVRQVRHEAMKQLKSFLDNKTITEDEETIGEKKIQEQTDEFIKILEDLCVKKEQELTQI
jgi:ribosome recycling factor